MGFLEQRANLAGRSAIVVGGGGGLGRACALDLAAAGVRVALCDRNETLLAETEGMIVDAGGVVMTGVLDARQPELLAAFFDAVDDVYGPRLDVLLNVVGGTFLQSFADSSPRGWDALIRTNFTWLLHSTHLAVPRMRDAGGSIINITSIEAHRAAPGYAVYAAMKAAVTSLTRTLAVELGPDRIRINTIAPDMVPTEGIPGREFLDPEIARASIPMGRAGTYEDVGGCALFLASDLSRYVTGTSMHPDGGAVASSGWFNWPGLGFRNVVPRPALDGVLGAGEKGDPGA